MRTQVEDIRDEIIEIRRQLHRHPEVRFDLPMTTALVREKLIEYGIEVIEDYGKSSIVGIINGSGDRTIALRADMDALDLQEENDVKYKSIIDGRMHGCGHDGHTAMLLGAAKILARNKDALNGRVKLIFQASEEGPDSGAKYMVEDGVLDDVDMIFGMHISTMLDVGKVHIMHSTCMAASDSFELEVIGYGGHASLPNESKDAIAMANTIYNEIQRIPIRTIDPRDSVVVTIGTFNGGLASNVIAERVKMTGTIRTFIKENSKQMIREIDNIAKNITAMYKGRYILKHTPGLPPMGNDPDITLFSIGICEEMLGRENIVIGGKPLMGSEDFAYYTEQIPGCMVFLGGRNEEKGYTFYMHNPRFDFDEEALIIGSQIFIEHVVKYLNEEL